MKNVEIRKVPKMGRGIFAAKNFKVGDVIEVCPVILIPGHEDDEANPTQNYSFRWNKKNVAILLGYGSLYNHSYDPNALVYQDDANLEMQICAHKPIKKGEQIFFNYNGEPDDQLPLWFTPLSQKAKSVKKGAAKKSAAKSKKKAVKSPR